MQIPPSECKGSHYGHPWFNILTDFGNDCGRYRNKFQLNGLKKYIKT